MRPLSARTRYLPSLLSFMLMVASLKGMKPMATPLEQIDAPGRPCCHHGRGGIAADGDVADLGGIDLLLDAGQVEIDHHDLAGKRYDQPLGGDAEPGLLPRAQPMLNVLSAGVRIDAACTATFLLGRRTPCRRPTRPWKAGALGGLESDDAMGDILGLDVRGDLAAGSFLTMGSGFLLWIKGLFWDRAWQADRAAARAWELLRPCRPA